MLFASERRTCHQRSDRISDGNPVGFQLIHVRIKRQYLLCNRHKMLLCCDQLVLGVPAIVNMQQTHLILMIFWYKSQCKLSRVLAPCFSLCGRPDTVWQSQAEGAHSHRVDQLVSGVGPQVGQWRFCKMTKKHVHFFDIPLDIQPAACCIFLVIGRLNI